ncbi:extracellular solute-binding protein [Saxibacter everestensis]|uniref:Extracellular solute-binding protein n=1 Tax=Saxibacter everestensis TaxID=2909229 RepID=A0ABY8QWX2_9MICO|nr:extracellular solute-binding protein [Brevibacteriaceae bacterium ZFBP1038]
MSLIRGLTWDHPRAVDSIHAASSAYSALNPGTTFEWTARPLHEFEDVPLDDLASGFDVLAIDHPFVGDAAASGALTSLSALLGAEKLRSRADAYIGRSYASYEREGELWALPVDAACMVAAVRLDDAPAAGLPERWDDVVPFIRELGKDRTVIAANPTHLWGTFLSLCEAHNAGTVPDLATGPSWWRTGGICDEVAVPALELMREIVIASATRSLHLDPVAVLDELAGDGPGVYTPLVFMYSTYSLRRDGRGAVSFHAAPAVGEQPTGTLTGGVGLAVSGRSACRNEAADFILFATSEHVQRGIYAEAGGQPASTAAWLDGAVNERAGGLYRNTASTMELSFLRPRRAGYPAYQRAAAHALHDLFEQGRSAQHIVSTLNRMWADVASH